MADLRDREVAVSEKNDSRMGPSGRRARSADSFYLEVGGSRDTYNVTVNFDSKNGHWCETLAGKRCHGNGNGKGQKYGAPQGRDKRDPQQWCKHVQAALADTEALAEAQERTARAFGAVAVRKVREVEAPAPAPAPAKVVAPAVAAVDRLAALEVEAEALRAKIRADKSGELRAAVHALVEEYGLTEVIDAARAA